MREDDFDEFQTLLASVFSILGKTPAAKVVDETSQALWFQALAAFPMPLVRKALAEHIQRGKFTPTPGDITTLIEAAMGADNRPGAEEAWALALSTQDDTKTVIWTQEAAEAFGKAQPVLAASGAISARKTFIEIYERIVAANRRNRQPATWFASPGTDQDQRQLAMRDAITAGLLPRPVRTALPAPANTSPPAEPSLSPPEQLAEIRRLLIDGIAAKQRAADAEIDGRIEKEDDFKRDLSQRVAERMAYIAMSDQAQVVRAERDQLQRGDE